MKKKIKTYDEVIDDLRASIEPRQANKVANDLGVSVSYLSEVLNGRRRGEKLIAALGYETCYRKK